MPKSPVDPRVELGRRIQERRRKADLTVSGLAAATILDPSNIRKIESGVGNPRLVTVMKIAGVLEVPMGELFAGIDPYSLLPPEERPIPYSDRDPVFWRPSDRISRPPKAR